MKFWQSVPYMELDQLLDVATIAEEVGFEGVMGADHALYPQTLQSAYPYTADGKIFINGDTAFPDPWVMIGAMAAVTSRLKFTTSIFILPLRNPVEVAKATSTLSLISGGRFIMSAGVGWMREEFEAMGVDFGSRGRRTDEMIEVLKKLWGPDWVHHQGEFFNYQGIKVSPQPAANIPIFTGGSSERALRRCARVADGWLGHGNTPQEAATLLASLHRLRREYGREGNPFETLVPLTTAPDYDTFRQLEDQGMTAGVSYPFSFILGENSSLDQKRRYLEQFAEQFIVKLA